LRFFSSQRIAPVQSIVLLKPEKGRKPALSLCAVLPTSHVGTVSFLHRPMTLATHALPLPTPAHRGAEDKASVAGALLLTRQARPSAADRRLEINVQE
jgi:hypothetical protein